MSFRARLVLTFVLAALVPVLLLGAGVRREMTRRAVAQADRRVASLTSALATDLSARADAVRERLAALTDQLERDNAVRLAIERAGAGRRDLLDWAGAAMRASGLALLQLQDSAGRILSSGHFRNEYDRIEPRLAPVLAKAGPAAGLVTARAPEGPFLALAAVDSLRIAGQRYLLVGGLRLDSARIAGLAPDADHPVALVEGDRACAGPAPAPARAAVPLLPCVPPHVVSEVRLPLVTDSGAAVARLVVTRDPAAIRSLQRAVDRWVAVAAGLALLLAAALGAALSTRVARPLAELAAKTAKVDLDRLDQTFATGRTDEIGRLADLLDVMSARLRASTARLRDAERRAATGDLARQVNHDVKNGLAPIRNVLRHLTEVAGRDPGGLAATFAERRGTLEASVGYLEDLARNYARLAPALDRGSCDAAGLVAEVAGAVARPEVSVATEVPPGPARVRGDAVAVRRILENLASNAVDALEGRPGRVTLAVQAAGDGAAPRVRLVVSDTGRGMSREELDRAFDDFFTTRAAGTGLGLSVVRRLVADLGGTLRVDTAPGAGSRFTVELPAA